MMHVFAINHMQKLKMVRIIYDIFNFLPIAKMYKIVIKSKKFIYYACTTSVTQIFTGMIKKWKNDIAVFHNTIDMQL